jgi:hypothetical protein
MEIRTPASQAPKRTVIRLGSQDAAMPCGSKPGTAAIGALVMLSGDGNATASGSGVTNRTGSAAGRVVAKDLRKTFAAGNIAITNRPASQRLYRSAADLLRKALAAMNNTPIRTRA